ncbi:WXG100 family type VII secretion target [Mycobacterium sp. smrl_JER01]|uniref:WXG100 family type VII secretion target n=1 Tax=Mycobacterium sp. smrl_JER01 TaxID=3402633 RepID=UPI003ABFA478
MAVLVVDFGQLRTAVSQMEDFGYAMTECLADIEQTMAALRRSWQGAGSDVQQQAQQRWDDGAEQMREALSVLREVVDTAYANYTCAVGTNGRMWQA